MLYKLIGYYFVYQNKKLEQKNCRYNQFLGIK